MFCLWLFQWTSFARVGARANNKTAKNSSLPVNKPRLGEEIVRIHYTLEKIFSQHRPNIYDVFLFFFINKKCILKLSYNKY